MGRDHDNLTDSNSLKTHSMQQVFSPPNKSKRSQEYDYYSGSQKDKIDHEIRDCGQSPTDYEVEEHLHTELSNNQAEQEEWHTQVGWTYLGHGEWAPPEDVSQGTYQCQIDREPEWIYKWRCTVDEDIKLHHKVMARGYPNRWGAKIPVKTKWNLERFTELLGDYEDRDIVEWIRYGWPTGRLPTLPDPSVSTKNHKGATEHTKALYKYIEKEQVHGAVMGPYKAIPFQITTIHKAEKGL